MLLAMVLLPVMDAIAKHLSTALPVLQIVWARYAFYGLALLPAAVHRFRRSRLRTTAPLLQVVRGALLAVSGWAFFSAVARMPLADAMACFFVYPSVVLLVSALTQRTRSDRRLWALCGLGFLGAVLALRPSLDGLPPGTPFALGAGITYALAMVATRRLATRESALTTSICSALVGLAIYSLFAPTVWQAPTPGQWGAMALMGGIAALGHFLVAAAHGLCTAEQLAPLGYTEIAAAVVIGRVAFGNVPSTTVTVGIALIVCSGLLTAWLPAREEARRAS